MRSLTDLPDDDAARWTLDQLHVLDVHAFSAAAPTPGAESYSVAFWFQTAELHGHRVLINQGDAAGAPGWSFVLDDARLIFHVVYAGSSAETAVVLSPSPVWRHVAGVIDRAHRHVAIYVDGDLRDSAPADFREEAVSTDTPVIVGGYTDPAGGHFDYTFGRGGSGWIDDLRIFQRALAPDEIRRFVPSPGNPPAAIFTYARSHAALRFDGRQSRAAGAVRAWLWDFGDGTRGYGAQPEHEYAYVGDYRVRLTVIDDRHATTTAEDVLHLDGLANPLAAARVFVNGTEGYACYRIPSIVRALNGDLIAFAEGRVESCSDSTDTIRAVCKRSTDHGRTWGALQVVARNLIDGREHAVQNISPVVDQNSGRIVLLYNKQEVSEWELARGHGLSRIFCAFSADHGATWFGERDITAAVHRPDHPDDWRVQRPTLGHAIQLERAAHRGRLFYAGLFTQGDRSVFEFAELRILERRQRRDLEYRRQRAADWAERGDRRRTARRQRYAQQSRLSRRPARRSARCDYRPFRRRRRAALRRHPARSSPDRFRCAGQPFALHLARSGGLRR